MAGTWILLRGLTRESRHWGDFPDTLRAALPLAEVQALDLPGNGSLNRERSALRVEAMVESCRRQLEARAVAPPYFLLAMSLGAMVAVAWALRYPREIAGGVLINTSLRPISPWQQRLRPRNYPALLGLLLRSRAEDRERIILRLTSCQAERPEIVAAWAAYRRQNPVAAGNALRQLLAAASFQAPAAPPPAPLLILAGAQDRLVDPRCSRELARRWQASFAEHPAAGHDLPLDAAPWVAAQVRGWLQALAAQQ